MSDIVQKLWGFCHTLRHDGIDYGDYIEQITYLLFLKMADERGINLAKVETKDSRGRTVVLDCSWPTLSRKSGTELTDDYIEVLRVLGRTQGILGDIYSGSQSRFNNPVNLKKLVSLTLGVVHGDGSTGQPLQFRHRSNVIPVPMREDDETDLLGNHSGRRKGGGYGLGPPGHAPVDQDRAMLPDDVDVVVADGDRSNLGSHRVGGSKATAERRRAGDSSSSPFPALPKKRYSVTVLDSTDRGTRRRGTRSARRTSGYRSGSYGFRDRASRSDWPRPIGICGAVGNNRRCDGQSRPQVRS
jgi:hypothetical protein